jgi:hypothetical protein
MPVYRKIDAISDFAVVAYAMIRQVATSRRLARNSHFALRRNPLRLGSRMS